jgi:hypothetical protein
MKFDFSALEWHAMSTEQRQERLRGEFGQWKMQQAARYVAALWWVEPALTSQFLICPPQSPQVRNGSAFFAEIAGNLLCITAAHVYRGFWDAKVKHPGLICRLGEGNFPFDAQNRLCGIGGLTAGVDRVDIATFHVTRDELRAIGKEPIVVPAGSWPPPHPFTGQQAHVVGFPGVARLWTSETEISFGLYSGGPIVGCTSETQITFPFEREFWVDTLGRGLPPAGMKLGGMSGGPVLFPTEKDRDWSLIIGGVISEMPVSADYEMITAVPAHFITSDGKILDERSAPISHYVPAVPTSPTGL